MATMLRQQEVDVHVDFYGFGLQDTDDSAVPDSYPDGREPDGPFLSAYEGRIDIESAGHTHTAALTVEVWDANPPQDKRLAWEVQDETELQSPSGELEIRAAAGAQEGYVELGSPNRLWRVRLFCAGREEVADLAQHGVPNGVERYLAQFWPATKSGEESSSTPPR
ncbi:hypothetical protein [Streptomyces syringium]|uniref:Uncharacterized protein n=1 Tax=Streptomyces syringium TaxID=76729 RepID=A0ABS4XXT1_9ACTN|nr:hypothetical protein [Streptomyces syringium]MBP2401302.1 hypothetical protein [Streptomyces syringium]